MEKTQESERASFTGEVTESWEIIEKGREATFARDSIKS